MDTDPNAHPWCRPETLTAGTPLLASCPAPPDDTPTFMLSLGARLSAALSAAGATTVGALRGLDSGVLLGDRGSETRHLIGLRTSVAGLAARIADWPATRPTVSTAKGRLRLLMLERGRWTSASCANLTSARRRWDASHATLGLVCLSDEVPPSLPTGHLGLGRLLCSRAAAASEERAAEWHSVSDGDPWLVVSADGLRVVGRSPAPPTGTQRPPPSDEVRPNHRLPDQAPLTRVGITGPALRALRRNGRTRISDVRSMSRAQLAAIPGIGYGLASRILSATRQREHAPAVSGPAAGQGEPSMPVAPTAPKPASRGMAKPRAAAKSRPRPPALSAPLPPAVAETLPETPDVELPEATPSVAPPHDAADANQGTVPVTAPSEADHTPVEPDLVDPPGPTDVPEDATVSSSADVPPIPAPTTPLIEIIEDNLDVLTLDEADALSRRFGLTGPIQDVDAIAAATGGTVADVADSIMTGFRALDAVSGIMTQLKGHAAYLRSQAPVPLGTVLSEGWTMGMPTEMVSEILGRVGGLMLVADGEDARFEAMNA